MPEITVPAHDAIQLDALTLRTPAQVNRSAWTGARKVIGLPGAEVWSGSVSISLLATNEDERQWRAFLFALGGPQGWFRAALPCAEHPGARPVVGAGASYGYTLPLAGMVPNTAILESGQFMTVPLPSGRFRTVCLTAPLVSDAGGTGTALFRPALTETPTLGATVETKAPFLPASPAGDELGLTWADGVGGTSFDVEEAR